MKPPRQKTSIRMKEARERLDDFEARDVLAEPPVSQNPRAALVFWICVVVLGLAIYIGAVWFQRY